MNEQNPTVDVTVVFSGPDWATLSTVIHPKTLTLMDWAQKKTLALEGEGFHVKHWKGLGYSGWQINGLRFGLRGEDQGIIMLSGKNALAWSSTLPVQLGKITRFDLQTTILLSEPYLALASRAYDLLRDINKDRKKPRYIRLIKSETGDTLYVGQRRNKVYLRLYDKSHDIEGADIGTYWRYEVEYKGKAAIQAYDDWLAAPLREAHTASRVWSEFEKRDVRAIYPSSVTVNAISVGTEVSDTERRLSWLTRCVSPVVTQLCALGHEERVLVALSLKHLIKMMED